MEKNKKLLRLFWVMIFALPICFLIGAIVIGKHRLGNGNNFYPPPPRVKQIIDKWRSQDFTKVELANDNDMQLLVGKFNFSYPSSINIQEKIQLTNSIVDFLRSYSVGTFESYSKFRFPTKGFYYSVTFSNFLRNSMSVSEEMIKNNPDKVWKIYWDSKIKDRFTDYWVGFSITNSSVLVEEVVVFTNSLDQVVKKAENVGVLKSVPCASFVSSPDKILSVYSSLKLATVRILPQTRDNDAIYPVYMRLYWSPQDDKWLPESLVCAYARPERKLSLIF